VVVIGGHGYRCSEEQQHEETTERSHHTVREIRYLFIILPSFLDGMNRPQISELA